MKNPFFYHNLISRIIRRQISVFRFFFGDDCAIPIIPMRGWMWGELWRTGPSFSYKGDELIWVRKEKKWLSVCSASYFNTLDEVDLFWEEYYKACGQFPDSIYLECDPF
jgi:hypothetical protein